MNSSTKRTSRRPTFGSTATTIIATSSATRSTRMGSPISTSRPAASTIQSAKIFPFKLHVAKQPYDVVNNYLLQPSPPARMASGPTFNWDNAFKLAAPITGLDYSGQYGFTETYMYWPTTHMVQPADKALQCDCLSRRKWPPGLDRPSAIPATPSNGAEGNNHERRIRTLLIYSWTAPCLSLPSSEFAPLSPSPKPCSCEQTQPLHPTLPCSMPIGVNVLESGNAVSTMQTCGQCHDTEFIQATPFTPTSGLSDYNA